MNGSAKRLMAVFAVLAMVASASVIILTDEQDSSADITTTSFYGDQLETDLATNAYNGLRSLIVGSYNDSVDVTLTAADKSAIGTVDNYIKKEVAKAVDAVGFDAPEKEYYYRSYEWSYDGVETVTISPQTYDPITFNGDNKPAVDALISAWIVSASTGVTPSPEYTKIKSIHDYVCETLSYDTEHVNTTDPAIAGAIRSVYTALNPDGDHKVVCEGYAKLFKVLCDHNDIPCIIVTGVAGNATKENHMWNYVYYDDHWFLVDCTWDDYDSETKDYYLLAGSNKTIGSLKVADSHVPIGISNTYVFYEAFELPALSALSVNGDGSVETGTQYLVTFIYDGKTFRKSYAVSGCPVAHPGDPAMPEIRHFLGWIVEGDTDYYDFSDPVTENLTIHADWTEDAVFRLVYDSLGGSKVSDTVVLVASPTTTITTSKPIKEGFKFIGWNTSEDGKGLSFKADDQITLASDYTLYAQWENTNSITTKVNNLAEDAGVFLSEEMVPGVSNLLLTIGVVTALVSLIAILAIARK